MSKLEKIESTIYIGICAVGFITVIYAFMTEPKHVRPVDINARSIEEIMQQKVDPQPIEKWDTDFKSAIIPIKE